MDIVPIHLHIELLPEGVYLATSRDVPGLVVQADTLDELMIEVPDCIRMIVESCLEHGDPLPPALASRPAPHHEVDVVIPYQAA